MTDAPNSPLPANPPRRRTGLVVALVVAAGLTGAAVTSAFSNGFGFGPGFGHGPGFGPGAWHGRFMGPFDPAKAEERADRMVRHLAIEIDASTEQQDKLRAAVKSAIKDIAPMREKAQAARTKARELLTQDKVDRAEIEKFRTEQVALADAFSKRVAQAMGDAVEILTPEQRRKIADRLPPHRGGPMMWRP